MFCQGGDTICNLFHIANICLVQTMKFTCTLRDEQSDQYSNWNKLHVAGHWTFQINCRKQNWIFFSFFFSSQPRRGGRRRGSSSLTRQNSEHQSTAGVKHIPGQPQWYSVPSPEEQHTTTSMQYPMRAYWYCLDNPASALCNAALSALPGIPTVSPAKQYHWQKKQVLVRADSSHPDLILWWKASVHEDAQIRELIWHKGKQAEWGITHSLTNPEGSRSVRLIQSIYRD